MLAFYDYADINFKTDKNVPNLTNISFGTFLILYIWKTVWKFIKIKTIIF